MRSAEQTITRALCLAAVTTRANAEHLVGTGEPAPAFVELTGVQPKDAASCLEQWLTREGLKDSLSPQERFWMDIQFGEWTKRDTLSAWWRQEGLMVLLWGLKIIDPMPAADIQVDIVDLLKSAWLLKDTGKLRASVHLRSPENISKARDMAEFWLWRVRTTQLQNSPDSANDPRTSKEKLEAIIAHAAETGERDGLFKRIGGDFPAFGKAFRDLNQNEWSLAHSICTERLYGLNWLADVDGLEWDQVETST
jgi:hypothetical protein